MEFVRRRLGLLARVLISGGLIWWLAQKVNWANIVERIRGADPAWLLLATVLLGLGMVLATRRWQILLRVHAIDPGFPLLLRVNFIGQFFNAFLLGTTGGDVVKGIYITQAAPEKRSAAALSVLLDRVVGLAALIVIGLVGTLLYYPLFHANAAARQWLWFFYLLCAGVAACLLVAAFLPQLMRLANFRALEGKIPFHARIERLSDALHRNVRAARANASAFLLSFVIHACGLLGQWAVARALNFPVPVVLMLGITAVVYVLISIPISVAGLGPRENLFVLFLGLPGLAIPGDGATAVSLLGFALSLFWSLVGGIVYLRYRHPLPPEVKTDILAP